MGLRGPLLYGVGHCERSALMTLYLSFSACRPALVGLKDFGVCFYPDTPLQVLIWTFYGTLRTSCGSVLLRAISLFRVPTLTFGTFCPD